MPDRQKLKVVLCWHMHQPEYRDAQGEFKLPWTYLHTIKDYVDMAAHLEAHPKARAVINFAPILLEQIEAYAEQIEGWLQQGSPILDPLLAALAGPVLPQNPEQRRLLAEACLKANQPHMVDPHPVFAHLVSTVRWMTEYNRGLDYVSDQFLADLLVWYHLVWMGESVCRSDARIERLVAQATHFTIQDRRELLELVGEILGGVLARYKSLARQGRVELSMTPYGHPIMPLLLDLRSAQEAMPDVELPEGIGHYPGGRERVQWHIEHGLNVFERVFGIRPIGCWPSEGSVSASTLEVLDQAGLKWAASGETVLANSLKKTGENLTDEKNWLYRPYRLDGTGVSCFFRDDTLSDSIGFKYSNWHGDDAAANFVSNLETIANRTDHDDRVVSVILDGENAWEYYPANGYFFLSRLYELLSDHPQIELTTFGSIIADGVAAKPLSHLVAGSWVYGTFSTWIGDKDKNRGWEMLADAKKAFDRVVKSGRLQGRALDHARHQLAICEGSDWCWWFGDYNPSTSVNDFDHLYRLHLSNLYLSLHEKPPEYLGHAFSFGGGEPATGGTMRRGQA
ncbi:glycoside hydrolase family 57 protein [Acidihalobacter ferrooxydans]|uniref:Glycoside hydrolase n=1 Tax=Acidihalobacter ferrooxydans TaxID=1765967 RepID=A0A1P8UHC1_9GAMM|nr:glycoside hydrolase family 57 protein [Acidihalobacter ferrooxydans]APZ43219.1 glycoside hydrolase [Acidihalobacter ferrooxydans]